MKQSKTQYDSKPEVPIYKAATTHSSIGAKTVEENSKTSFGAKLQRGVDSKVESTLVGLLEQKYQEVAVKLDQAELVANQSKF